MMCCFEQLTDDSFGHLSLAVPVRDRENQTAITRFGGPKKLLTRRICQ
jgi:hypothetical protein